MSRPTNNYSQKNINFIKTIAEIGAPFNSPLLDNYNEYMRDLSSYTQDKKECFLSILNKVGEDGCQVLTDRIINYIDDVSNIDTSIPSALLSQANSIGFPYKDNKTVEQLARLSKCSQTLQNLVWASSTNVRNARTILSRLNIIDEDRISSTCLSAYNVDAAHDEISGDFYDIIFEKIFDRHYLYLSRNNENYDVVSSADAPSLLDFSWMVNAIYSNEIIQRSLAYQLCCSNNIDFGKYNRTIYSIVCYNYLYSQIYTNNASKNNDLDVEYMSKLSRVYMPFLYDNKLFDPLQAAWSIIFNAATLTDYDERYHEIINAFIKAFNEKLDRLSYKTVIDFLLEKYETYPENDTLHENYQFVYRLNANSFTYQQLMYNFINDVRTMFGIDIIDYVEDIGGKSFTNFLLDNSSNYFKECNDRHECGFKYLGNSSYSFSDKVKWEEYISAIIAEIFKLGKKIKTLREDLRIMTLRNSYKGTAALIQFSTIEYLRDCIDELLYQAQQKYNDENKDKEPYHISKAKFDAILKEINEADQESINVGEYWDYTEYFNRVDNSNIDQSLAVDWYNPSLKEDQNVWLTYGTMDEDEIFDFYKQVLNLPKDVLVFSNGEIEAEENKGINLYPNPELDVQKNNLKMFLKAVYNSGVFTQRTNSNYEAIYSGVKEFTTNDSPWVAYKNTDYISKEIHPYIWNFTQNIVQRLYNSGAVTTAIQNAEFDIVNNHIGSRGNIIDQYRLSSNFVDSSGYVTRYEHRNHLNLEKTLSYDGILYPEFAYEMINKYDRTKIDEQWDNEVSGIRQKWYENQTITLSKTGEIREKNNLKDLVENQDFLKSVNVGSPDNYNGYLKDYCIDRWETAYAVSPYKPYDIIYKENGYPFMRKLVNFDYDNGTKYNKGMLFVKANDEIDTDISIHNAAIEEAKSNGDRFPRIVMSEDGTHLLLRTDVNKIRSYYVTTHRNIYNEVEPALKLNVEISCDRKIFSNEMFNDSLIKTVDDAFYILVPKLEKQPNSNISSFSNYIFYIDNNAPSIKLKKETFGDISNANDLFRSGLYLNSDHSVFANTYYINNEIRLSESLDESDISAVYCDPPSTAVGNHHTLRKNWDNDESSFDVFNQFIQMYASSKYDAKKASSNFYTIKIDKETKTSILPYPSVNLQIDSINSYDNLSAYTTEISIDSNGFLNEELYKSEKFPFARVFNINSDAGFNPVYIGEDGKIILENRDAQFKLTKKTGAAYELLGPQIDFDQNPPTPVEPDDDIYNEISDDNDINFERIHEFYSFNEEVSCLARSFDKNNQIYQYGYASIVEDYNNKFNVYAIKSIQHQTLDKIGYVNNDELSGYVEAVGFDPINSEGGYLFNRIYIFLGVRNTLYSLIPRVPDTKLQIERDKTVIDTDYSRIKDAFINANKPYSIEFEDTYVFDKVQFSYENGKRYVRVYGNERELINAELYLVHVVGSKENIRYDLSFRDVATTNTVFDMQAQPHPDPNYPYGLFLVRNNAAQNVVDDIIIRGDNDKYYRVYVENEAVYAQQTFDRNDINRAYDEFYIKGDSNNYDFYIDIRDGESEDPLVVPIEMKMFDKESTDISSQSMQTPNFMLPDSELKVALISKSDDMIDDHMRAPHLATTKNYQDMKVAYWPTDDPKHENFKNEFVEDGSLVFSITEVDSEFMNRQMPDQEKNHSIKSVTTEAFNDYYRFKELKGTTFDLLKYSFVPWQIVDLNLKRVVPDDVDIGYDPNDNSVETQYIIQPYNGEISISQDSFNKYTISFWRGNEKDNNNDPNSDKTEVMLDNRLPDTIKTTEKTQVDGKNVYRPIFGNEHESLYSLIKDSKFIPRLMVQWEYSDITDRDSPIRLRFNNSMVGDSPFINTEAGLEYKSLSLFKDAVELDPGESQYIDIVAPNHVQIGSTVFYNIPLMKAYVTNISDNKPKFMLTIMNDKVDRHLKLESNSYALVFISASTPQTSNSDIVYVQCYVAPMLSNNQTKPPSITNAISLSELSFNFDVANIINPDPNNRLIDFKHVNAITGKNRLSKTATAYVGFENNIHQIKVSEPYGTEAVEGFKVIDMKIDLKDLTEHTLKNALFTAHGDVIAYDSSRLSCPIVKIFGCSLDRIGTKHVLGVKKTSSETENRVLSVTQNSERETALLVNPSSKQQ